MKRVRESGLSIPEIAVNWILKFIYGIKKYYRSGESYYEKNSDWFVCTLFDFDDE